jgi:hypothetical protein
MSAAAAHTIVFTAVAHFFDQLNQWPLGASRQSLQPRASSEAAGTEKEESVLAESVLAASLLVA